ncbi:cell division protein FtsX [Rodentibacter pneumotropicus]|uniref:Cell division protein FtsX n=1 Tax=Rodentibacter pneumotropicus TaxID=758 RepID=A0A448MJZ8_9PAST|nr:cell division protein FtsX [Rodentibacter pneumotropicus]
MATQIRYVAYDFGDCRFAHYSDDQLFNVEKFTFSHHTILSGKRTHDLFTQNLTEEDANLVVEKIRQQEGVDSLNYVSRQESLKEFKSWSGFGEELDILDDNPLPAVVMVKPTKEFNASEKREILRTNLDKIKGVQEVRLDNDWMEKLTALSWLVAHVAIFCTVLMVIAVFW